MRHPYGQVSQVVLPKHFPDKGSLLAEMALLGFDSLRAALTAAEPRRPKSLRDEFFAVAGTYVRFGVSNSALYLDAALTTLLEGSEN